MIGLKRVDKEGSNLMVYLNFHTFGASLYVFNSLVATSMSTHSIF